MPDFSQPHKCKGSLAIVEETTEACWNDPEVALKVLIFAAMLAGLKAGTSVAEMMDQLMRCEGSARTLLGMDEHATQGPPPCPRCNGNRYLDWSHLAIDPCPDCNPDAPTCPMAKSAGAPA